jgi:hypothetical protein
VLPYGPPRRRYAPADNITGDGTPATQFQIPNFCLAPSVQEIKAVRVGRPIPWIVAQVAVTTTGRWFGGNRNTDEQSRGYSDVNDEIDDGRSF